MSPVPWFPSSKFLLPPPVPAEVEAGVGVEVGAVTEAATEAGAATEAAVEAVVLAGVLTGVMTVPEVTIGLVSVAKVFGAGVTTTVVIVVFKVFAVWPRCLIPGAIMESGIAGVTIPVVPIRP